MYTDQRFWEVTYSNASVAGEIHGDDVHGCSIQLEGHRRPVEIGGSGLGGAEKGVQSLDVT